ncbi:MAG: hypothetical protein V1798_10700 [Pseudomonadota bacterium]
MIRPRSAEWTGEVLELSDPGGGYNVLSLKVPRAFPSAGAGSFVMLSTGAKQESPLRRPMAIHDLVRCQNEKRLDILFTPLGPGTRRWLKLKRGDRLSLLGPIGNSFSKPGKKDRFAVVAGGTGLAAFLLWRRRLTGAERSRTRFYFGFRNRAQLAVLARFRKAGLRPLCSVEGPGGDFRGTVVEFVQKELPRFAFTRILACGPEAMLEALLTIAAKRGVPVEASLEAKMACGVGACLSCVTDMVKSSGTEGYALVCRDGPIFELSVPRRSP